MPPDTSASVQADAHVCLLDALGIHRAASWAPRPAGLSIRYPGRVSALLLMPMVFKPALHNESASPMPGWVESAMVRISRSDFLVWTALHVALVARCQMINFTLGTLPELMTRASPSERDRVNRFNSHEALDQDAAAQEDATRFGELSGHAVIQLRAYERFVTAPSRLRIGRGRSPTPVGEPALSTRGGLAFMCLSTHRLEHASSRSVLLMLIKSPEKIKATILMPAAR